MSLARSMAAVGLIGAVTFFCGSSSAGFLGPDEPRHAQVAREMLQSGDWVTPRLMGQPWLDKPPLYHWSAALAMSWLGEDEGSARLPSALAALITCGAIVLLGFRLGSPREAAAAGFILAVSLGMTIYARAAIVDSVFTASLTVGLGAYLLHAVERASRPRLAVAYAAFGAAVLAKGPAGIVLPLLVVSVFHRLREKRWHPELGSALTGLGAFSAVALPWHLAAFRANGWELVEVFFLHHNLDRFLTTVHRHEGPIYYYVPVFLAAMFPWSTLVPPALKRAFSGRSAADVFLLLWIGLPFAFFSLAGSKLPGYILPVLPPAALLVARLWADESASRARKRALAAHPLFSLPAAAAIVYLIRARAPEAGPAGWALAAVVALSGVLACLFREKPSRAFATQVGTGILSALVLVFGMAPRLEPSRSLRQLAASASSLLAPGERAICYKTFYRTAIFYTEGRLGEIWTLEEFRIRAREWGRIVILTERWRFAEILGDPSLEARLLEASSGKVLAEVRPRAP